MRPPGFIVSGPDPAVTVHSDIRRTGEHKETFFRVDPLESFPGCSCHVVAEQVVDFFVDNFLSIYIVIETLVIVMTVGKTAQCSHHVIHEHLPFLVIDKGLGGLFRFLDPFCRVEDGGFVHIVPESFDALIRQKAVFVSRTISARPR